MVLFVTVFTVNVCELHCLDGKDARKVFHIEPADRNQLKQFYENFESDTKTVLVISNLDDADLTTLRFATVVLPLTASSLADKRYIKVLSATQKVLLTSQDDDLSLNDTETFLQNFWRLHKTTKIFVMERNVIYFFNPFIYDYDAETFGRLQTDVKWQRAEKRFPMRIEVFASTYSEPFNWRDFSKGFNGPDIQISKIISRKMNFEGELRLFVSVNQIGEFHSSEGNHKRWELLW